MKFPGRRPGGDTPHATMQLPSPAEPRVCLKCTAVFGAHFLTCPTLRLPLPWPAGRPQAEVIR